MREVCLFCRQKHDEKYQKIERDCHQPPMIRVINLKLISSNCASLLARLGILIGERQMFLYKSSSAQFSHIRSRSLSAIQFSPSCHCHLLMV